MSLTNLPGHTPSGVANHFAVSAEIPATSASETFVDRRSSAESSRGERRQFGSSHKGLSEPGRELALAIDQYKVEHHRRYITCDEMLKVLLSLGYSR
ncbi:hypothetical protein [Novipirellula artificiosorum]|uniref:Uncharacterized protein n=1 Tax=Novipirellula artificiosorum TaxID=2528016 RepID=A0A5C6E3U7_9BACT|nr:hypothetical protein [Novipirellula artificiosorum]TWU42116.1 hypothetical protein Poly41_04120 [Novipirellula artificiosorum]